MLKFRQLFGLVVVFLFLIVDEVSSLLRVASGLVTQRSSSFYLSLQKLNTARDHALNRSLVTGLQGDFPPCYSL